MKRVRRHILVRAPGKLFVLGEYAVLDGGTAAVAAVDRGAHGVFLDAGQQGDFDLGVADRFRVLVALGAAGAADDGPYAGDLRKARFDAARQSVTLLE